MTAAAWAAGAAAAVASGLARVAAAAAVASGPASAARRRAATTRSAAREALRPGWCARARFFFRLSTRFLSFVWFPYFFFSVRRLRARAPLTLGRLRLLPLTGSSGVCCFRLAARARGRWACPRLCLPPAPSAPQPHLIGRVHPVRERRPGRAFRGVQRRAEPVDGRRGRPRRSGVD